MFSRVSCRRRILWVDSGTTALAIALQLAAARTGRSGGEVVLPGYGCPDSVVGVSLGGPEATTG